MKFVAFYLGLMALTSLSAKARLGETEEQLVKRLGPAQTETGQGEVPGVIYKLFSKQHFTICVGLLNGVSAYESYQVNGEHPNSELPPAQIKQLLDAQSQGHKWGPLQYWSSGQGYFRDDGAFAVLLGQTLIFKSKTYAEKESTHQKALEKAREPNVNGF